MRTLTLILLTGAFVAGCAAFQTPPFQEAYHVDREFGVAQMRSWDSLVAFPEYPHAHKMPTGQEGITAEEVMKVHNATFAEKPESSPVLSLGIIEE